mgnify:CR=1 FL=1
MLDQKHPQAQLVLKAAKLEDAILEQFLLWRKLSAQDPLPVPMATNLFETIQQLAALNHEGFGNNPQISRKLEHLKNEITGGNASKSWKAFCELTDNSDASFGTWEA